MGKKSPELPIFRKHLNKYNEGDILSANEAAEVVSENSGHVVSVDYMGALIRQGRLPDRGRFGHVRKYLYDDVKDLIVSRLNLGPKFRSDNEVKGRAIYMRDYRKRRAAREAAEASTKPDEAALSQQE